MDMDFDDFEENVLFPELEDINDISDLEEIESEIRNEIPHEDFDHPGGSPKPVQDDPFCQKFPKLKAEFDGNQNSRIFYKRVTGNLTKLHQTKFCCFWRENSNFEKISNKTAENNIFGAKIQTLKKLAMQTAEKKTLHFWRKNSN